MTVPATSPEPARTLADLITSQLADHAERAGRMPVDALVDLVAIEASVPTSKVRTEVQRLHRAGAVTYGADGFVTLGQPARVAEVTPDCDGHAPCREGNTWGCLTHDPEAGPAAASPGTPEADGEQAKQDLGEELWLGRGPWCCGVRTPSEDEMARLGYVERTIHSHAAAHAIAQAVVEAVLRDRAARDGEVRQLREVAQYAADALRETLPDDTDRILASATLTAVVRVIDELNAAAS